MIYYIESCSMYVNIGCCCCYCIFGVCVCICVKFAENFICLSTHYPSTCETITRYIAAMWTLYALLGYRFYSYSKCVTFCEIIRWWYLKLMFYMRILLYRFFFCFFFFKSIVYTNARHEEKGEWGNVRSSLVCPKETKPKNV